MYRPCRIYPAFALILFLIAFSSSRSAAQLLLNKQQLTGHIRYRYDTGFVHVPNKYAGKEAYLRRAVFLAYQRMYADALKAGIKLNIISGTRSFDDQVYKWESKWGTPANARLNQQARVLAVMKYSSMPGTSRHHWGTEVDLVSLSPAFYRTPYGQKVYNWLVNNAYRYGFRQPFTANRKGGYLEEKWHWSYAPLAKGYLTQYTKHVSCADIKGFPGSQYAGNINVIQNWVLQINPQCIEGDNVSQIGLAANQFLPLETSKQNR